MIDEREHRRGLVLGFTLAEALLLLLFLLLLVFGARVAQLEKGHEIAEARLGDKDKQIENLKEFQRPAINELETGSLRPDDDIRPIIEAARKIDPNDPPAVLQRGLRYVEKFGTDEKVETTLIAMLEQAKAANAKDPTSELEKSLVALQTQKEARPADGGKHNWPPIITLSEADGHFFQSGSAQLSKSFEASLTGPIISKLLDIIKQYDDVNVIEVIGHTDEQPIVTRSSNLDTTLLPYLQRAPEAKPLIPGDNAGLGIARAASVVRILSADPRLRELRILPLSGAQAIHVGDALSNGQSPASIEQRRRIEIRVRRSDKDPNTAVTQPERDAPQNSAPPPPRKSTMKTQSPDWLTSIFGSP